MGIGTEDLEGVDFAATFRTTPLFQTNFLPDLIQV